MECATTIKQLVGAVSFVFSPNSLHHVRKTHLDQIAWDLFIQNPTTNNGGPRGLSKAAKSVLQDVQEIRYGFT